MQLLLPALAAALPSDGQVVGGHATIQHANPSTLDIHQSTDKAIINWQSFSIGRHESVRFAQPSVNSIALNRVIGVDPSVILGQLQANGRIFLINPNGILFGAGAQINVGGLLATTFQIRDEDFMAGRFLFAQDPLKGLRSVINHGTIRVSDHGFVFLVAPGVANDGLIVANLGKVVMGSGQQLTLDLMGDGLINYAINGQVLDHVTGVDGKPLSSAVSNSGTIQADGGQVILSAKASGDIFSSVVNQSGVIRAKSLVNHGGVVRLEGSDPVANTGAIGWQANLGRVKNADGAVLNTGTIDVSAAQAGAAQGQVTVTGQNVGVAGNILARGAEGAQGGQVLLSSTNNTVVTNTSVVDTSGNGHSSAGNVVIWSDGNTRFGGHINATGGSLGGDGGHLEVSGHRNLAFTGQVETQAPNGTMGTLLLDPTNITVATGGTATAAQVDQFADPDCAPGGCTIAPATINANANITLQANNDITVSNAIAKTNAGRTLTMQAGRNIILNANVGTTNAAISMTANDAGAGAGRAAGAGSISGAGNVSSGNGAINLTLGTNAGGAGSINLTGVVTSTGTTTINAGAANDATLNNAANNFGTVAVTSGNNVTVRDTNALVLGASTVSGNLNATTGGAVTQSGALAVTGLTTVAAGANNITLTNAANDFSTVGITSGNNVALRDANALDLAASTVNGTLGLTTAGAITQSGALNVAGTTTLAAGAANDITLNNAGNVFGTVGITTGNNVTLQDSTTLNLAASTVSGALNVTANGAITDSGNLVVAGTTTLAAGAANNITLNNTNNFSTVSIASGNNVALVDSNAIDLGASTINGTLGITSAGAITQSGALSVVGTTTLAAGAANNITLNNAANNFSTVGITTGNNVTLQDSTALNLAASTISGTLGITSGGAITQSGALTVAGAATFAAGAANNITLNNAANNFSTVGITSGNNVNLRDANALILGASTVSGAFDVTTAGAVAQSGALTVAGAATFAAGAANNITLNNAANNFSTVGITTGNNVALTDANALNLAASTVSGTLGVTTNGAVTQSGALTVTGAATFAAGAANDITLNNVANNFSTVGITTGNNVSLRDANALILGASTISGALDVTTNGAVTQSGALAVTGAATFTAGAANNITLNNAANNFSTVGITTGNNVNLRDTNALVLGASAVSGTLGVTTNGALTQSGALAVAGVTTLAAGAANNITLNNAANNFSTVGITAGNNVVLTDANALNLAASTVSGTLALTTGGALTQSGALAVTGTTSFTATAASSDILLDTQANSFGGALSFAGTQANFRDVQLRNVSASATVPTLAGLTNLRNLTLTFNNAAVALPALTLTAGGNLTVTAGGAITDTGNVVVPGTTTLTAGVNNITLDNANNFTGAVSIVSGNSVTLNDINALDLGASTISGTLGVTTAGAITQSGVLNVAGATTLAAGAANNITLNNAANNFSTVGITSGNNVALTDANALNLGTSSVSGTLNVTTNGALTQSGPLVVAGATTLSAGTANDITLTNAANNFSTASITSGNNVALADANALILGASTISGTLGVTTAGAITQSGVLNVAGATTLTAGAANNITLNNAANNFSTVGITTGNNVALTDANALDLGTSTISGTFNVAANGVVTQSGALNVAGATTLAAGAANNIVLNNAANNFSAIGITSGNNVTLRDANALILGSSTISGAFDVTTSGALTQSGPLNVAGTTTLAAGAVNNIVLTNAANSFSTVGITSGNNVALTDSTALTLAASTVSGTFDVTTGGTLSQSGALMVTGTTTLTATATNSDVLLGTQANNFGGAFSFAGTQANFRDVSLRNVNAGATVPTLAGLTNLRNLALTFDNAPITLPALALTAGGNLAATAGGTIAQSGALTVPGTVTLATTAAGSDILLNTHANNVTGAVTLGGTTSNIRDLGLRNLNAGATVPALAGLTNLRNLTLTFDNAPITVPTLAASGAVNLTAGGSIIQSGTMIVGGTTTLATTVAGSDILLNTQPNNFTGAIDFGGTTSNIRDVSLRNVNAGASVPTLVGLTNLRNLTLTFNNAPVALPALTLTSGGNLTVTAGGAITDTGNLVIPGTTTLTAGVNDITLDNANNFTGPVSIVSGNNVTLTDINALTLGASTINGTLAVTTNGALTQSGALNIAGATTLAASAANDITLTNAGNDFSTVGITSGHNVALTDSNALDLAASTISGTLGLTAGGPLSQSGVLNVTGATTFTATTANTDVLLATQANDFGGGFSFAGTQANIRDARLRNVNAGATVPTLAGLTNLRNLTLTFDNAPITLPALTASGNLTLTAGGTIAQSGAVTVGGATTLATTVAGSDILLDTQPNNFTGAMAFGGTTGNIRDLGLRNVNAGATVPTLAGLTNLRNLTLTFDNAPISLPAVALTAGGNLSVTAGGTIMQSGTLMIPGTTTLATTVAGSDILLNTQPNNFTGAIAFGGTTSNIRDLGLRNVNAGATVPTLAGLTNLRNLTLTFNTAPMVLPTLTASGNLVATAGGLISQAGALTVAGAASFDTTAAPTLGSVTLANGAALTLNTSTVGGNLTATTTAGDLTLPAGQTLTVVGDATLTPAGSVNLLGTTRIGGTQSSVGGTGASFVLGADTNLNALPLPGTGPITVTTTGTSATFAGPPLLPSAITLGNTANQFGGPVSVTTAAPAFTGSTTATHNLTQSAPVTLNPGQSLTVTDLGGTAGTRGNITLTNTANSFETVTFTGGNIAWAETGPVTIGGVSANAGATSTGSLAITATGPLTQTGALTAAGPTTLAAGAANNITLTNAANDFSTVGITSGNNVALTDANALNLAASTINGTLAVTTNGAVTQSGALTVAGTTTLAAGTANDITLTNAANDFSTVGITSGNNVALTDANALNLAASTVSGTLSVTTGGALSQSGALAVAGTTTLAAGAANDITLTNAANDFSTVGITSGNNVALTDATVLTLGTSTISGNLSANAADLTVAGAVASGSGSLNLTAANSVTQLANLSTVGANSITVTAGGPITMAPSSTTASGTGALDYTAGTDVMLGSLSTGGGVAVIANGGSVLSAAGSGTNVTAGANSTLQAFNGVVGTQSAPITVNVNPGTLSIRATGAVSGISAFLTGTVLPGNALTLLNVPPGIVCFNSCPSPPNNDPLASLRGIIPSFNVQSVVPWYRRQPSDPPMISVFSTYIPQSLLSEDRVDLQGTEKSVRREVTPCFPLSSCNPPARTLSTPAETERVIAR